MELRKDVKRMLNIDWEPKVPDDKDILKQVEMQLNRGKSSGNVTLDFKVTNPNRGEKKRKRLLKKDEG